MKRLSVILTLLLVLAAPQIASAAPFVWGPVDGTTPIFDTSKNLLENLEALNNKTGGSAQFVTGLGNYDDVMIDFAGIGYSQYVKSYNLTVYNGNSAVGSITEGYDIAADALIRDISLEYYNDFTGTMEKVLLADLTMTVMQVQGDLQLTVNGYTYTYTDGLFFGFSIPGSGNAIDFILSGMPQSPAVPVPAAVWLLGTGIIGLVGLRRKRL